MATANGCLGGGSLSLRFGPGMQPVAWSGPWGEWIFDAPADTVISRYSIFRHVRVHIGGGPPPRASSYRHYQGTTPGIEPEACNPNVCSEKGTNPAVPRDAGNEFRFAGPDTTRLGLHIVCWRADGLEGCPSWWEPSVYLFAADITLRDELPPTLASVNGDLGRGSGPVSGVKPLVIRANDRGSGVRKVGIEMDGRQVAMQSFEPSSGRCAEPFAYRVPCPLSGETVIPVDTARVSDGPHQLRIVLADAAENQTRSAPYPIHVDNGGGSCVYGSGPRMLASVGRKGQRTRMTVRAGHGGIIKGRLTTRDGQAIVGAAVRVLSRRRMDSYFRQAAVVQTGGSGRFRLRLGRGPSRRLRLAYCSPGGGATRELRLRVSASTSMRSTPRTLRNGKAVTFSGKLIGGWVPRVGKLLEIQAHFRGRWRTVSTARTDARGRWHFKYRFDGTRGRVRYRFRAFVPSETGYPFNGGASRAIPVTVIGQ